MEEVETSGIFGARRTSFGAIAAAYDAVRPDWPAATVAWMLGSPTAAKAYRVVDLGAGTGLGTRAIAAMGHGVLAVEPSAGMRDALMSSLSALPERVATRISTLACGAEDIPVETGSVDAVTAFQSWHWFDETAAAAECARVLRPGGWLSMGWHHRSEDVAWLSELADIVQRGLNQPDDQEAPPVWPEFEPSETELFTHRIRQSVDDLVLHASTWSYVAIRPERDRILDEVRALGRRVADRDGMVDIPMTTRCYRLRRR
ncbi:MAG: class I SAM-dependent methyltransferase [Phycicoccus sp.]|nr:class I SAM-dependent methyltransferase [Phycicoccus sp.]NMM35050.1 class I SAM-dependent methyltransferase [Phycicoccus sp.]